MLWKRLTRTGPERGVRRTEIKQGYEKLQRVRLHLRRYKENWRSVMKYDNE
jgi:hypothetical protein